MKKIMLLSLKTVAVLIIVYGIYIFTYDFIYKRWLGMAISHRVSYERHISNHIVFQSMEFSDTGRIYDEAEGKVTLTNVDWVVVSDDKDTLAVFCKNGKRGYVDRFTGKIRLPAIYSRAWIFSEGLAAVEKDKRLMFIDHNGNIVIDTDIDIYFNLPRYVFKNGYCIIRQGNHGKCGLIDRDGNWAIRPEYSDISFHNGYWLVEKDGSMGLFSAEMKPLFDTVYDNIEVYPDRIEVFRYGVSAEAYDMELQRTGNFHITEIGELKLGNGKVADCMYYRTGFYATGIMDRNGNMITPPIYTEIEAVKAGLYFCNPGEILIDRSGKKIRPASNGSF